MSHFSIADASRQLSRLVNLAAYGREVVTLTSRGKPKAVLLGMGAFRELVGVREAGNRKLMTPDTLQRQFRQALAEAGYGSPEGIVELVRKVRQEAMAEKDNA